MKVLHVVPHINAEASGPSYSVPRLCESLAEIEGCEVELACLAAEKPVAGVNISIYSSWPFPRRLAFSASHTLALRKASATCSIVHNHSLWAMVNVAAGFFTGRGAKLVTSPRGTLSEWAMNFSKKRKKLLWPLQKRVLSQADLIHATSLEEYKDVRRLGFRRPVVIIPNGIDLPPLTHTISGESERKRRVLFLSRIHPTKNIESLLEAWSKLEQMFDNWELLIAGPGEQGYVSSLILLANRLDLRNAKFVGPIYGDDKVKVYAESDLFILPSHSENFGMVVAEALAHGCPAIVGVGAPWKRLESENCGWWIPNDVDSIAVTLQKAMSLPSDVLKAMGGNGRKWMDRDFGWPEIASKMESAYRWILGKGDKPECVILD